MFSARCAAVGAAVVLALSACGASSHHKVVKSPTATSSSPFSAYPSLTPTPRFTGRPFYANVGVILGCHKGVPKLSTVSLMDDITDAKAATQKLIAFGTPISFGGNCLVQFQLVEPKAAYHYLVGTVTPSATSTEAYAEPSSDLTLQARKGSVAVMALEYHGLGHAAPFWTDDNGAIMLPSAFVFKAQAEA